MERAHRIGQVKPVRVYRLVCRGSVEERMVSRAEKKLFLNAMVAEADPDEQLHEAGSAAEESEDARRQAEISEALGIGGTAISKGELASLIRFGANAVVEGTGDNENGIAGKEISDEELDALLEMQGRDKPRAPKAEDATAASSSTSKGPALPSAASNENLDDLAKAQQSLRDRMQMLKEVDLRQLGSTIYDKKKRKSTNRSDVNTDADAEGNIPGILDSKRVRKERVVMMDGRGTGYGGAVPVLAETIEKEAPPDAGEGLKFRSRGRQWSHHTFCCMCGRNAEVPAPPPADAAAEESGKGKSGKGSRNSSAVDLAALAQVPVNAPVKCAHCPFIFHLECTNGPPPPPPIDVAPVKGQRKRMAAPPALSRPSGMFICPHHRCCLCNRSTASAGGLLFRCTGCMTAYCEDCLPQDEIDSVGRCRPLEKLGYDSKQSYFIRCPYCCQLDGFKPGGILQDNDPAATETKSEPGGVSRTQSKTSLSGARSALSLMSMNGDKDGVADEEVDVGEDEVPPDAQAEALELESAEETIIPLKTQLMRIQWNEIIPTPEPSPVKRTKKGKGKKGKKGKKGGKAVMSPSGKRKLEVQEDSESEEDESSVDDADDSLTAAAALWREWSQPSPDKAKRARQEKFVVAEGTPAGEGMLKLMEHPLWEALRAVRVAAGIEDTKGAGLSEAEQNDSDLQLFSHVVNKIESGKLCSFPAV
jgi:hypothetical protein